MMAVICWAYSFIRNDVKSRFIIVSEMDVLNGCHGDMVRDRVGVFSQLLVNYKAMPGKRG